MGLAATSACGSSWTLLFTPLHVTPVVFVLCGKPLITLLGEEGAGLCAYRAFVC